MIIFDVDFDTFNSLKDTGTSRVFYLDRGNWLELYTKADDMLFRYIYVKRNDENDIIFSDTNLIRATRILNMSMVNETDWRTVMNNILARFDDLIDARVKALETSGEPEEPRGA